MASSVPTFPLSCLAPSTTGQSFFLFGVPSPGRLEVHSVDLSNPIAPTSTFISATTTAATAPIRWDAQRSLGCYAYLGDSGTTNNPITVIQFGSTVQTQFFPNGTWTTSTVTDTAVDYVSPRKFSLVGSTGGWSWFVTKAATKSTGAAGWRDIRVGAHALAASEDLTLAGSSLDPLLTVGAIAQDIGNYGNGLFFSFDQSGASGTAYRAVGNKRPDRNLTATEPLLSLTKSNSAIDMNGNQLSSNAVPATSAFAAFILDKSPTGTIALFSIDPRSSTFKLAPSSIKGNVPVFLDNQSVTSLNSKIVVYGGGRQQDGGGSPTNTVHVFDVISGTWQGPDLVDPTTGSNGQGSGSTKSGGLSAGVLGGIAAVAVLLVVAVGAIFWRIRRNKNKLSIGGGGGSDIGRRVAKDQNEYFNRDSKDAMISLSKMDSKRHSGLDSNITLTPTEGAPTVPNTPKSVSTVTTAKGCMDSTNNLQHDYRDRHSRPQRPNRLSSTYSVRSERSSSHISLYPAGSAIFLANSPSSLPPTPMVPAAYSVNGSAVLQHYQQTQQQYPRQYAATAPSTPQMPPNRKSSVYKVLVPDDYDDRQPLRSHRESCSSADEYNQQQQSSTAAASSSGSPASINASAPWSSEQSQSQSNHQTSAQTERKKEEVSTKSPRSRKESSSSSGNGNATAERSSVYIQRSYAGPYSVTPPPMTARHVVASKKGASIHRSTSDDQATTMCANPIQQQAYSGTSRARTREGERKIRVPLPLDESRSKTNHHYPRVKSSPTTPTESVWSQNEALDDDFGTYKVEVKGPRIKPPSYSQDLSSSYDPSSKGLSEFPMPPCSSASSMRHPSRNGALPPQQQQQYHPSPPPPAAINRHQRQEESQYSQQQQQQQQISGANGYTIQSPTKTSRSEP
ncbi:hypothetical protein BGX28_009891 [Mortierella sp. GBA30]|nr:hypothetical protein BGX28_009891 [Mortierella sp. GBA30]